MRAPARGVTQAFIVTAVFAADRLTKFWARGWLRLRSPVVVLPFFHLTYVENTGAAFGVLQNANGFFIALSCVLLCSLWYWRRRLPAQRLVPRYALALVAGGALGNLYDRVAFGHVVDFLDFLVWPVFNVADSCISVGAACLALALGFEDEGSR